MKCKLLGNSTAVRYDPSCDNTYDSHYVSDWHSKAPVLIDGLGRIWCFHQALALGESSFDRGLRAAWQSREEEQSFKTKAPLVVTQILGTSMHSLKQAAVPAPGRGHVFCPLLRQ